MSKNFDRMKVEEIKTTYLVRAVLISFSHASVFHALCAVK